MPYHFEYADREGALDVYQMMLSDRTLDTVMWGAEQPTLQDWLDNVDPQKGVRLVCAYDGDEMVGATWAMANMGTAVSMHFVVKRSRFPEVKALAKAAARFWFGEFLPRPACLFGVTPAPFRHVFNIGKTVGWKILGKIPGACRLGNGRCVAGVVSIIEEKDMED